MHIFTFFVHKVSIYMVKIAIFASGSGTNTENISIFFKNNPTVEVAMIISNKIDAYVHVRAKELRIPSYSFSKHAFENGEEIVDFLHQHGIDFIVLAGFLLKISSPIIDAFPNKIINIHPALLPKFGGKGMYGSRVHEAVKNTGEKESGITIHYVNENYDEGNIIFQARCPITSEDTPDDIAKKVHILEYQHFPTIIAQTIEKECKSAP